MKSIFFIFLIVLTGYCSEFMHIQGWEQQGEVLRYNSGNLWEYINGAADQFIDFGFEELQAAEFVSEGRLITLELYNMGTPINAFGVYMIERPAESKRLPVGTESVINWPSQSLILKGNLYVKIQALEGNLDSTAWTGLLSSIVSEIPGDNSWPQELELLPDEGLVPNSFGYVRTSFLGLSELNNCIFADYVDPEAGSYQNFVVIKPADLINELPEKWQKEGNLRIRKIPYQGFIGLKMINDRIVGAAKVRDREKLVEILEKINQ